jgi:hypothetical protein
VPKRVRCQYCDRLFSRDQIDRHVLRCRAKGQPARNSSKAVTQTVVVDGSNVAYHLAPEGKPRVKNLSLAYQSLTSGGLRPVFVISAGLIHVIDRPEVLQDLMAQVEVVKAPRGTDDDLSIIRLAQDRRADIVSNDRFLNWVGKYPWLHDRLRKYRMTPTGLILV